MGSHIGKLILVTLLIGTSLYWGTGGFNSDSVNDGNAISDKNLESPEPAPSSKSNEPQLSDNIPSNAPKDIELDSLDELIALFDSLDYNTQSWIEGNREVPRLTFEGVSDSWQKTSNTIPVQQKKMVFFRLMAPMILVSNENILIERQLIKHAPLDSRDLVRLALKYRAVSGELTEITEEERTQLLTRVDIIAPSLVLAQAAEESGWATSRFTLEGNSFFGQWDFSGNGMIPKRQRQELGNYGLARFDSPLASVESYMLNLNTHNAYQGLRSLRSELRRDDQLISGHKLAGTLEKYSERGQAYIDGIREMIRFNKLEQVDEAYLSNAAPLHLIKKSQ